MLTSWLAVYKNATKCFFEISFHLSHWIVAYAPLDVFFMSAWILSISCVKIVVDSFWRVGTEAPGMKSWKSFWTSGLAIELNDHPTEITAHSSWASNCCCFDGGKLCACAETTVNFCCFLACLSVCTESTWTCFVEFVGGPEVVSAWSAWVSSLSSSPPFHTQACALTTSGEKSQWRRWLFSVESFLVVNPAKALAVIPLVMPDV